MIKVYGTNTVYEAILNNRVSQIYLLKGYNDKKTLDLIEKYHIRTSFLDRKSLDNLTNNSNHQGIVAVAKEINPVDLNSLIKKLDSVQFSTILILDGLKDPHNLGAIIRSADLFNASGIIYKKRDSVSINETVEKVSTGAINYVPLCEVNNLTKAIEELKKHDYWVIGFEGEAKDTIETIPLDRKLVIVIGSEGEGISRLVKEHCDFLLKIPMAGHGHINSLNASNAAAIVLYEIFKKR